VFFFGIIAVTRRLRYADFTTAAALAIQGFHVAEHVLLTSTLVFFGKSVGFSTYFGLLKSSEFTVATGVVFHFSVNALATVFALLSLRNGRRYGHITWDERSGSLSVPAWV
jgi:hypothetical protein